MYNTIHPVTKKKFYEHARFLALSNSAANELFGFTIHSALSLPISERKDSKLDTEKENYAVDSKLQKAFAVVEFLFIDEFSFIGLNFLRRINERL